MTENLQATNIVEKGTNTCLESDTLHDFKDQIMGVREGWFPNPAGGCPWEHQKL